MYRWRGDELMTGAASVGNCCSTSALRVDGSGDDKMSLMCSCRSDNVLVCKLRFMDADSRNYDATMIR